MLRYGTKWLILCCVLRPLELVPITDFTYKKWVYLKSAPHHVFIFHVYDTADHTLLLTRLQRSFGVEGGCLAWFTSYLSRRSYCVVINNIVASCVIHVAQDSVLGPLLFILYMADLADIAAQYNLTLHVFADDNQLYIHCKPENVQLAVASVQQCVTAIEQWMDASRLRLNIDKTELIWTGTKHNLAEIPGCGRALTLGAAHVAQSDDCVLGVQPRRI